MSLKIFNFDKKNNGLKVRDALTRRGDLDKIIAWKRFQAREQCGGVVSLCVQRTMLLLSLKQKKGKAKVPVSHNRLKNIGIAAMPSRAEPC